MEENTSQKENESFIKYYDYKQQKKRKYLVLQYSYYDTYDP